MLALGPSQFLEESWVLDLLLAAPTRGLRTGWRLPEVMCSFWHFSVFLIPVPCKALFPSLSFVLSQSCVLFGPPVQSGPEVFPFHVCTIGRDVCMYVESNFSMKSVLHPSLPPSFPGEVTSPDLPPARGGYQSKGPR